LRQWRWKHGTYVIPRPDAEKLLETFDSLCVSAKSVGRRREPKPRRQKEELVFIAVTLPSELLYAVDEYARQHGLSRSAVVRNAIQQLIEMRRALEELDEAREGQLRIVALRLPRDLLHALNERAAALKATRAAIVRYAIYKLLQKVKQPAET
jgi:metal-responsive CopG/Arc/MetJ family transcriptional regulator